jgi:hypothetical protein
MVDLRWVHARDANAASLYWHDKPEPMFVFHTLPGKRQLVLDIVKANNIFETGRPFSRCRVVSRMAGRSGVDHSGTGHASRNQTVLKTTTNSENGRSQDRNGHYENVIHSENGRHRSRRGGVNPRWCTCIRVTCIVYCVSCNV